MPEKDPGALAALLSGDLARFALMVAVGIWAGLINHLIAVRSGKQFSWLSLGIEMSVSGFTSVIFGSLCVAAGMPGWFTLFVCGAVAHQGTRALVLLDDLLPDLLRRITTKLKG